MESTALRLSLLLTVLALVCMLTSANPIGNPVRPKRQAVTNTRTWTVSEWSPCSSTCGGGIRARSVRCLDEDDVIVQDCDVDNRPASFEFCNQVDCSDPSVTDALPASGIYSLVSPDGPEHAINFTNQDSPDSPGAYTLQKNTVETDGSSSSTTVTVTSSPTSTTTSTSMRTIGRSYVLSTRNQNGLTSFTADGDSLITLNGIESLDIASPSTSLSYSGSTLSVSDGTTFPNIDTLYFYDGFLFYRFNSSKINSLSGPGRLYTNRGVGLYSINIGLNSQLDNFIAATPPAPPTDVPEATDGGNTDPVTEPSVPPSIITVVPPNITEAPPTTEPVTEPSVPPSIITVVPPNITEAPPTTEPATSPPPATVPTRPKPRPKPSTPQPPDISRTRTKPRRPRPRTTPRRPRPRTTPRRPRPSTPQPPDISRPRTTPRRPRPRSPSHRRPSTNPTREDSRRTTSSNRSTERSGPPETRERPASRRPPQNPDRTGPSESTNDRRGRPDTSPMSRPRSRRPSTPRSRRPKTRSRRLAATTGF